VRRLCIASASARGVYDGHLAVQFVDERSIVELNARYRTKTAATDVLAFPVDGVEAAVPPRELGDVVVCPERALDLPKAIVHGVLHLAGMDHETDQGEMLRLQARVLREAVR
jgi:probable rRNA maturation factor